MATKMKRVMVSISPDLEQGLDAVKQEQFNDKPYSEVCRYLFALGLKAASANENAATEKRCERVS